MSELIASSQVTLIVGLGVTGLSVARFLAQRGQKFIAADAAISSAQLEAFRAQFADTTVFAGELDYATWRGVSEIVLSPGVPRKHPAIAAAIADGVPVIGDIELFARHVNAPVIAITGSNGKTTVTTMLGNMAQRAGKRVAVGGNIGTPALDLLAQDVDLYVLELSSFQLESTESLRPQAATILNISNDHMDRYPNLQQYHIAKQRIYFNCQYIVVNRDDVLTHPPLSADAKVIRFGLGEPDLKDFGLRVGDDGVSHLAFGLKNLLPLSALRIQGKHNQMNALAALALGKAAGLDEAAMLEALCEFKGLAHRCQYVANLDGVVFVNDSKATNVGATQAALLGLANEKNIVLIAGGEGKGADFSPLQQVFAQHVKALLLIGRDSEQIAAQAADDLPTQKCSSLSDAVVAAQSVAQPGDIVLLSPACASFDMFANYEDRGNQFCYAVESL